MLLISLLTIITLRTLPVLNKNLNEIILPNQATKDRKSTRLNSSHSGESRMPSSA